MPEVSFQIVVSLICQPLKVRVAMPVPLTLYDANGLLSGPGQVCSEPILQTLKVPENKTGKETVKLDSDVPLGNVNGAAGMFTP